MRTHTIHKQTPIAIKAIKIGSHVFTAKAEVVATLFQPIDGKTASGHYAKKGNGIMFHKLSGEPWFFLVANRYGERFFVSCGTVNGRTVYMHSLSSNDERLLGIDGLKYSEGIALAEDVWNELA